MGISDCNCKLLVTFAGLQLSEAASNLCWAAVQQKKAKAGGPKGAGSGPSAGGMLVGAGALRPAQANELSLAGGGGMGGGGGGGAAGGFGGMVGDF